MEDKQKRLARLTSGSPIEIIETLLNSMHNFFMGEIGVASDNNLLYLVILGDHAVALTISEGLFGKAGLDGYKLFLEKFVDQGKEGFNFSEIAENIGLNNRKAADEIKNILHAQAHMHFFFDDGSSGNLIVLSNSESLFLLMK